MVDRNALVSLVVEQIFRNVESVCGIGIGGFVHFQFEITELSKLDGFRTGEDRFRSFDVVSVPVGIIVPVSVFFSISVICCGDDCAVSRLVECQFYRIPLCFMRNDPVFGDEFIGIGWPEDPGVLAFGRNGLQGLADNRLSTQGL